MASITTDRAGAIEAAGVEYLPRRAAGLQPPQPVRGVPRREPSPGPTSCPAPSRSWSGLSFLADADPMVVGIAVGTLVVLPTAIIGPRTGTRQHDRLQGRSSVSGRFIGSGIAGDRPGFRRGHGVTSG